jgi:hypothetical protein
MSIVGTVSAPRQDGVAFGPSLATRLALGLIADKSDGNAPSTAPASSAPVPAIPLETGVDFTTLFAVRYAAALRAVERRRRDRKEQRSRKEGSSW